MHLLTNKFNQAIITLGGKGTRLKSITKDVPKPLYPIEGISTLERSIKTLSEQGILKFIFFVNYKSDLFKKKSIELKKKYDVKIKIIEELKPKGEAGSIFDCIKHLEENFLFINGDIIFDFDLKRFINYHLFKQSDLTIMTHLTNHPDDSDCIIESPSLSISKYKFKNSSIKNSSFFLGMSGISLVKKKTILELSKDYIPCSEISFFKDIVINSIRNHLKVFSYNTSEYLKDMGTPERLGKVKKDIINDMLKRKSYRSKQKVLFLDRDNTLIKCPNQKYISNIKEISIFKNRLKRIKEIAKSFDFSLIITNQPQISMGIVSWQEVIEINGFIINLCQNFGLEISGFYLCPHHPHEKFENEIKSLKVNCFCRKPLPGLFYEAAYFRNIDLKNSLLIGDSQADYYSAKNLNMNFLDVKDLDFS